MNRIAVLDVGSNSVLTLVCERRDGAWHTLAETSRVTGLGAGAKTTGLLSEEGMTQTLQAIADGFSLAREWGAEKTVAAATMAARITRNVDDFCARGDAQGTPIIVLSADDEARLGFLAVANDPLFAGENRLSIIDPGGHSTEICIATRGDDLEWNTEFRHSFAMGALGLREGVLAGESPDAGARLRASTEIDQLLSRDETYPPAGVAAVLGATGTNLVSIRDRLATWQPERVHGATLDFEEISRAVGWLFGMTDEQRRDLVGMEPGRERTLHIGCLILERCLFAIGSESCRVSVRGWRHALLEEIAAQSS